MGMRVTEKNKLIKISTVKYANSYPMNWGLIHGPVSAHISLDFDHPAGIAHRLLEGISTIGLLPVAAIPGLSDPSIIGNFCIGSTGRVRTVMLLGNSSVDKINTIWLDHRSVTSVNLARVLARYYWKKDFIWKNPGSDFDYSAISEREGIVIIGDQCFEMESRFAYGYDLSEAWNDLTGLPFVFACWVAIYHPGPVFLNLFNQSLQLGIDNIEKAVNEMATITMPDKEEIIDYLKTNIDYPLDYKKRKAINLFLKYLKTINQ